MEPRKPIKILCGHVLSMFNSEPAISWAVGLLNLGIEVEDCRDCFVTDSMRTNLQAGGISLHHAIPHQRDRMHFIRITR